MNADTATLVERPYLEIVDDLLTAIVGGVVNEPIHYDVKEDLYALKEPATDIRAVTGTHEHQHYVFQKEVDFVFSEGDNAVVWQEDGVKPDDETVFYIDYLRRNGRSPLSDTNVGSVTRTLTEAIGREIATVYQQINLAYLSGFVDTAEGKSLELVVSILGVARLTKDAAQGFVTFFRDTGATDGNVTIAERTVLRTAEAVSFTVSQQRTLQRGQVQVDVPVRATEAFKGKEGVVGAGKINVLAQPITGIGRVSNAESTVLGGEDESDEQLRARAKAVLRGLGKATALAIQQAIAERGGKLAEVWDPNGEPDKVSAPGTVKLLVEAEPARFDSVEAAVNETRAAGVHSIVVAQYVFVKPRIVAKLTRSLPPAGKAKVIDEIIEALEGYFGTLEAGATVNGPDLLNAIRKVDEVVPRLVDVIPYQSDTGKPSTANLVDTILQAIAATPAGDAAALRTTIEDLLAPAAPTGERIVKRELVKSASKDGAVKIASDADIEAGTFQVATQIDGENWSPVLDIEPTDIALIE